MLRLPLLAAAAMSIAAPAQAVMVQAIFSDQTTDQILLAVDLDMDGDAEDPGETAVFFDENNLSGLVTPTDNVFTMTQTADGDVYFGDGVTDTVYRLRDLNGDDDAQDPGEAQVWFSAANAEGLPLQTPNGVAAGPDGAVYVVQADTVGNPVGDAVYRTVDLNGDGDADDAGESSQWLDLTALSPTSSPFEIRFDGDVAYIIDSNGGGINLIYRAEDENGNGVIDPGEVSVFIDEDDGPIDFGLAADGGALFTIELLDFVDDVQLFRYEDLNDDGVIDGLDSIVEVWNSDGTDLAFSFSLDVESDRALVTSNGTDPEEDSIYSLFDTNGDGDFFDAGEEFLFLSRDVNGALPVRPRAVIFYDSVAPVPLPATLPILAAAAGLLAWRARARSAG
ncbi:MAG: hypothetical protein AAF763_15580 [Pseudomonadota bacterium]